MPTPALILETVKAVCVMLTEFLKYYQTPAGQAQINEMLKDKAAFTNGWNTFLEKADLFFKGELFKKTIVPIVPKV